MNRPGFGRRIGVVAMALAIASAMLRPQLSSAFVTRGDELSYRGDAGRAREMYRRALIADGRNVAAVDRFAFSALMSHDRFQLLAGLAALDRTLGQFPDRIELRMDRALCEHALGRFSRAAVDFEYVGMQTHDPRSLLFAALDNAGTRKAHAEHLLRAALAADPNFRPARRDLSRLEGANP